MTPGQRAYHIYIQAMGYQHATKWSQMPPARQQDWESLARGVELHAQDNAPKPKKA